MIILLTHNKAHLYTFAWAHTFLFTCHLHNLSLAHGHDRGSVLGNGIAGCAGPHPDSLERKTERKQGFDAGYNYLANDKS